MSEPLNATNLRPIIRFDGRDQDIVTENLLSLRLEEQRGGLSTLELRLIHLRSLPSGETEFAFDGDDIVSLGKEVYLGMGEVNSPVSMFRGIISAIEEQHGGGSPPVMLVLAEDALQGARMARRTTVHADLRLSALAEDVANQLGLRPNVQGLSEVLGEVVQVNESDLSFLRRMLARYDADLQVIEDELHVAPVSQMRRGLIELDANVHLLRCRVTADLAHQATSVTVSGFDAAQGRQVGATGAPRDLGPGQGDTGAAWLDRAFGRRAEHVGRSPLRDEDEARALADTLAAARARGFVRLRATAQGDPNLRVGAHVRLDGVGSRFRNTYVITSCCHSFDLAEGYITDFEAECAHLAEAGR